MSTDVFAVVRCPAPAASGDLVLAVDDVGTLYEVPRDQPGGVVLHYLRDWDGLIDRIAQSASVVIEHGGEPDPIVLGPRLPDCAEDPWLTAVVECLLSVLSDLPSCCQLVNAAVSRLAGVEVTFARRPVVPARRGWGGGGAVGHRFQLGGRWVRELPVGIVPVGTAPHASCSLVVPDDLPGDEAVALASHPLVLKLAGLLGLAGPPRLHLPISRPVLGLIRAVVAIDASAFAAAAAALTHTVVTVVGRDGTVIASSVGREEPGPRPPGSRRARPGRSSCATKPACTAQSGSAPSGPRPCLRRWASWAACSGTSAWRWLRPSVPGGGAGPWRTSSSC